MAVTIDISRRYVSHFYIRHNIIGDIVDIIIVIIVVGILRFGIVVLIVVEEELLEEVGIDLLMVGKVIGGRRTRSHGLGRSICSRSGRCGGGRSRSILLILLDINRGEVQMSSNVFVSYGSGMFYHTKGRVF